MPDITNYDGRLEQMAYYCEAMLDNIAKVNNAYHDSVENEYIAALPSHVIKWKGVKRIGGKTIVWNQLVDSGTTTVPTINGHKYYTMIDGTESIITSDGTAIIVVDDTADMVCDLTLMFGSGNEPATTSDFTAIFGATHYSYNVGTLLSAGVTDVVSKDSNNTTLQTYSIPAEIQALEGYGWSAGVAHNYIDFERKKFVKCVDRVDMGNLTWYGGGKYGPFTYFFAGVIDGSNHSRQSLCCSKYASRVDGQEAVFDKMVFYRGINWGNQINVADNEFDGSTPAQFKTAMSGVYLYYELATPIETDISAYLTDDNLINVEAGGTLTFPNSNGDDYKIPVPVQLEYIGV